METSRSANADMPQVTNLDVRPLGLAVSFDTDSPSPHLFTWLWLLDNSHDPTRYNSTTHQRRSDAPPQYETDPQAAVVGTSASLTPDGLHVSVKWSDGSHEGIWPVHLLAEVVGVGMGALLQPVLWATPPETSKVCWATNSSPVIMLLL